jgi:hypothetical protein
MADELLFYCETRDIIIIESYIKSLSNLTNDTITILIKKDGLYFIEIATVFYSSHFDNYFCNKQVQIEVELSSFLNAIKTVNDQTVLSIFIKNRNITKLRILQQKGGNIQRDIITIKNKLLSNKKRSIEN